MAPYAHLCLVLHNHQPIGNFDGVFEQSYQDSYLPFLEVFEPYDALNISLHTSGPLMLWLAEHHPEYITRLRYLVEAGRVEIIGGPKYEPIMTMLPRRDRVGQINAYTEWLNATFGCQVAGMWTPERVWEPQLTADIANANIAYTVLDDFHFRGAGWSDDELTGYFITEEDGEILRVFPGSERLRYTIPFAPVHETIDFCRSVAARKPGAVLVFGDDGEKFGTWPDTKEHVYDRGWLRAFFDALCENQNWLKTVTLAEATRATAPVGKIYLPDCSYREMTEWSLPVPQQELYDTLVHSFDDDSRWQDLSRFVRGGFWRNFKVKYSEAGEMYARMMDVSNRLAEASSSHYGPEAIEAARDHLYRGQCNCPYWHGAFGGIYLPHLRNAVYHHLIAADSQLELERCGNEPWVEATTADYDFDGLLEVRLANDKAVCWVAPGHGGRMYELDVRGISHNLLATMQRRPEAYHRKVLAGPASASDDVASIHDRVVFKQDGLDQLLQYDRFPRKSLMDHFYDDDVTLQAVQRCEAVERGDFVDLPFDAKLRRANDRVQLQMTRSGNAWGVPLKLTKAVTMVSGSDQLEIAYLIEQIPVGRTFHFAVEMNFAGLPAGADDRFFSDLNGHQLGQLGCALDQHAAEGIQLTDQWLGINVGLTLDRPSGIWAFPVETVSQSEGGFELVHQSVCVQPHWMVRGDAEGRWGMKMQLSMKCLNQHASSLAMADSAY
jgi:4-alpha-glucanotransferase